MCVPDSLARALVDEVSSLFILLLSFLALESTVQSPPSDPDVLMSAKCIIYLAFGLYAHRNMYDIQGMFISLTCPGV